MTERDTTTSVLPSPRSGRFTDDDNTHLTSMFCVIFRPLSLLILPFFSSQITLPLPAHHLVATGNTTPGHWTRNHPTPNHIMTTPRHQPMSNGRHRCCPQHSLHFASDSFCSRIERATTLGQPQTMTLPPQPLHVQHVPNFPVTHAYHTHGHVITTAIAI